MREILFRGNRKDNGEWIYGYYLKHKEKSYICETPEKCVETYSGDGETLGFDGFFEIDNKTLCQYTGLTDKNGKKIFEGDIIAYQHDNEDCPFPNKDTKKRIGRVFFQNWRASFALAEGRNGSPLCNQDLFKYVRGGNRTEVIGNVWDNPELLMEWE